MTVSNTGRTFSYTCDGVTSAFSFPRLFFASTDLVVTINGVALTLGVHYTVSGAGTGTGTVTTTSTYASGTLTIASVTPVTQQLDLSAATGWDPASIESAFDKLTIIDQEQDTYQAGLNSRLSTAESEINTLQSDLDALEILEAADRADINARTTAPSPSTVLGYTGSGSPFLIPLSQMTTGSDHFDAEGSLAGRSVYDSSAPPFKYLVNDVDPMVFYQRSGAAGVWLGPFKWSWTNKQVADALNLIRPEEFGAAGTGLVDDTAAVQAAIDAWVSNGRKYGIKLEANYLISGTLRVANIETLDPEARLQFTGSGTLIKNNAGFMFDKPAAGQALQTGHIFFDGIRFVGANLLGQTFIINGDNVIRVHFRGCFGTKINIAKATDYIQTIYCDSGTTWREWSGYLFDCNRLYDVSWGGVAEVGDGFLIARDAAADPACNSLKISGNIEGLTGVSGPAIKAGVCFSTCIENLYCEANAGGDIDLSNGTGFHKGLVIKSCGFQPTVAQLANTNYFPVITGKGAQDAIALIGNSSTHNLFDVTAGNQSSIVDIGNYCPSNKIKFKSTSTRLFQFQGFKFLAQVVPALGVFLDGLNSSLGFANTKTNVSGTDVSAEILMGATNPQTSPGDYGNRVWQKGSIVFNSAPANSNRQYGVDVRSALILGWICLTAGSPGTWQEISIMRPY